MIAPQLHPLIVPVESLHHDPANARRHGERNLETIKASLAQHGQLKPIVVQRQGMIVRAGNGTLAAAKSLGWTEIAATVVDMDNATAVQFAIADNRTAELAEWDSETLATLLDGMDSLQQEAVGFNDKELTELMLSLEPESAEGALGDGATVADGDVVKSKKVYEIVFDDEPQQTEFYGFLRYLKTAYPDCESAALRLMEFIREHQAQDAE